MLRLKTHQNGFTMLELIVVLACVIILATLIIAFH